MTPPKKRTLVSFDWAMKNMLRDKANFDILEGFLTTLLGREIIVHSLLESEGNQEHERDKFNRVDLLVEDEDGMAFIIEIQYDRESHYLQRLLYGTSKLIVENIQLGEPFSQVRKVVSISILYFLLGDGEDDYIYYGQTELKGLNSGKTLKLRAEKKELRAESADIFPEYYLIEVERFKNEIRSEIDEWIYFFKNSDILDSFRAKNIQVAREKLARLKMTPAQQRQYDQYLVDLAISKDIIQTAHTQGKEEGKKEGKEEGKEERTIEFARMMLASNEPIDKIMRYTGLDEAELHRLSTPH